MVFFLDSKETKWLDLFLLRICSLTLLNLSLDFPVPHVGIIQRIARTKAGIAQKELCIRIGMEPSSASGRMNHYENALDIDTLKRMADELGVSIDYFFCENETTAELARLIANM